MRMYRPNMVRPRWPTTAMTAPSAHTCTSHFNPTALKLTSCLHCVRSLQGPIFTEWFKGGKTNIAYNCLDRHVKEGYGDQVGNEGGSARSACNAVHAQPHEKGSSWCIAWVGHACCACNSALALRPPAAWWVSPTLHTPISSNASLPHFSPPNTSTGLLPV